ncbi:MAG TPA: ATP-binding protein [Candidatus Saccharimonadales bacterium]|nr:ATP-binding protein [Candidatus Saccharimonadales bacterium]
MAERAIGAPARIDRAERPMVLLVEDEPTVSKVVGHLLEEAGYGHVTIADHAEIASAVERWDPQCVILDSEPPSASHGRSWADAAAIRRAHPDLPVLMFTADEASMAEARAGTSARSEAAGFAGVMDKPFLVLEFLATLKHAVEKQHPERTAAREGPADVVTLFPAVSERSAKEWVPADFFSTAVHELRTPLTSILGQAQLARRYVDSDPARAREAVDRVIGQSVRMNRLIGDLLDNARVTAGALSLQVVTFDLGRAIADTIPQYEHGDVTRISLHLPPEPALVRGDPDRIAQIIGNLLDNALKFSPPASPIEVSLRIVGGEVQVCVEDQGLGVPADERDRIFAPFYRTARTRDIPGTGLGLHISRRLAEQHRGRLWLEPARSPGCGFTLALPLVQESPLRGPLEVRPAPLR